MGPSVSDRRLALVVDDDPDIALVCSLHLEGAGFEVVEVNIEVNDVHLPGDDTDDDTEARVA